MFDALDIPASALLAQRARMDTIANNMASADIAGNTEQGVEPYRRRFVLFAPGQPGDPSKPGVHVEGVGKDQAPFRKVHEPGHKYADKDGYVQYPNVEPTIEMVNMISASRAYEANVTMMETIKQMINSTLRLLA
ncbi:MAG TPA: flagellar basal body rod protein FlgC [Tepidisphaeraceae bacterium]|jgi:flagellar basal-body rod protein FlgC